MKESYTLIEELEVRKHENFSLYAKHINEAFAKILKLTGYGKNFRGSQYHEMFDENGNAYLDLVSGYGTLNAGHNHPYIKDAIHKILDKNIPSFSQIDCNLLTALAAEKLSMLLPEDLDTVYFCNSGSEAVDAAIRLARKFTGKKHLLYCDRAFHGSSLGVLSITDHQRRDYVRPLIPGTIKIPYNHLPSLTEALEKQKVAAFVLELIQGEGGILACDHDFANQALALCRKHKTLMIVDEVQTGFGRCGKNFASELYQITPDMITFAKSLGGGLAPAGAFVCNHKIFQKAYGSFQHALDLKNTFGGGAIAMAASIAMIELLEKENLALQAHEKGKMLKNELNKLKEKHRFIEEVRGTGLMLGIKIRQSVAEWIDPMLATKLKQSAAEIYTQYLSLTLMNEHRIIAQVAAGDYTVLKIMPSLLCPAEELMRFLQALDLILEKKSVPGSFIDLLLAMASKHE